MSELPEPSRDPKGFAGLSDEKLLKLVIAGRRKRRGSEWELAVKAWQELSARHYDRLRGQVVAFRFPGTGSVRIEPAEYEDATQECYLRALKMLDNFRGTSLGEFLGALRTCAINTCMDYSRRRLTREKHLAGSIDEPAHGQDDEAFGRFDPELGDIAAWHEAEQTETRDALAALEKALAKIESERTREVLRRKMIGYSSKEIADELGLTVANVDQITSRGVRKLKELMSDE